MRTDVKVATISFAVVLGACNSRREQATGLSEDLKRDLAVASASAGDLATAPTSYQRTRFVSDVEMARSKVIVPHMVATKRRTPKVMRAEAVSRPAEDAVADPAVASNEALSPAPAPVATPSAPTIEPAVIVQRPTTETMPAPDQPSAGRTDGGGRGDEGGIGDRGRGGGLGGILGGIIGAVVIRGGHGGVDKCDPRTDGRRRGGVFDRPENGGALPFPIPRGTFPTRM
jgi:hypothetical protein